MSSDERTRDHFHIPFAPSSGLPSRQNRIARKLRTQSVGLQALSILNRIDETSKDLPFGSKISEILSNYHFPSAESVRSFFQVYLSRRRGSKVDDDTLDDHIVRTINLLPADIPDDAMKNGRAFERVSAELIRGINEHSRKKLPLVRYFLGPSGAGKSAFSKSLFTVCLRHFWSNNIVPCRVEYSRYPEKEKPFAISDPSFYSYLRRCMLRDLLIFTLVSGKLNDSEKDSTIKGLGNLNDTTVNGLEKLLNETRGCVVDGENITLSSDLRGYFTSFIKVISKEQCDIIFYRLSSKLKVKYLISFDGFDCIRIEHFLFDGKTPSPISYLAQLLKGLYEKINHDDLHHGRIDAHYLAYTRDVSYERLRPELMRGLGKTLDHLVYWIVPPRYDQLVENAVRYIIKDSNLTEELTSTFSEDIFAAFDRVIFDANLGMNAATHMNFIFGSNARIMKHHIKQTLFSALHRASQGDDVSFSRFASGIDPKSFLLELINKHGVRQLPAYIILEDLFLNETRQLFPKLQVDSADVTRIVDSGSHEFRHLLGHVEDKNENTVTFGCIFNYFYRYEIRHGAIKQPALLLLIRILQFIHRNSHRNAGEVFQFLWSIGYRIPVQALHFTLCVLIRAELLKWDATRGAKLIQEIPFYITTRGIIAITKLVASISYISENIITALNSDRTLSDCLRDREFDNVIWVADCVNNASIALHIIGKIEAVEKAYATENSVAFDDYPLYDYLNNKLSAEAESVLKNRRTTDRWELNRKKLIELKGGRSSLIILGEVEK